MVRILKARGSGQQALAAAKQPRAPRGVRLAHGSPAEVASGRRSGARHRWASRYRCRARRSPVTSPRAGGGGAGDRPLDAARRSVQRRHRSVHGRPDAARASASRPIQRRPGSPSRGPAARSRRQRPSWTVRLLRHHVAARFLTAVAASRSGACYRSSTARSACASGPWATCRRCAGRRRTRALPLRRRALATCRSEIHADGLPAAVRIEMSAAHSSLAGVGAAAVRAGRRRRHHHRRGRPGALGAVHRPVRARDARLRRRSRPAASRRLRDRRGGRLPRAHL